MTSGVADERDLATNLAGFRVALEDGRRRRDQTRSRTSFSGGLRDALRFKGVVYRHIDQVAFFYRMRYGAVGYQRVRGFTELANGHKQLLADDDIWTLCVAWAAWTQQQAAQDSNPSLNDQYLAVCLRAAQDDQRVLRRGQCRVTRSSSRGRCSRGPARAGAVATRAGSRARPATGHQTVTSRHMGSFHDD